MSAPILPDSPSVSSVDESVSASGSSNLWNRSSTGTAFTELDDIYDVSDEEYSRRKPTRQASLKRQTSTRRVARKASSESLNSSRGLPKLTIPGQDAVDRAENFGFKKLTSPVIVTPSSRVEMSPAVVSFYQSQQLLEVPTREALVGMIWNELHIAKFSSLLICRIYRQRSMVTRQLGLHRSLPLYPHHPRELQLCISACRWDAAWLTHWIFHFISEAVTQGCHELHCQELDIAMY